MTRIASLVVLIMVWGCISFGYSQDKLINYSEVEKTYGQGVHHYFNGEINQARSLFAQALEINERDPRAHYFLGLTYLNDGNSDLADRHFRLGAYWECFLEQSRKDQLGIALERIQGEPRLQIEQLRRIARQEYRVAKQTLGGKHRVLYGAGMVHLPEIRHWINNAVALHRSESEPPYLDITPLPRGWLAANEPPSLPETASTRVDTQTKSKPDIDESPIIESTLTVGTSRSVPAFAAEESGESLSPLTTRRRAAPSMDPTFSPQPNTEGRSRLAQVDHQPTDPFRSEALPLPSGSDASEIEPGLIRRTGTPLAKQRSGYLVAPTDPGVLQSPREDVVTDMDRAIPTRPLVTGNRETGRPVPSGLATSQRPSRNRVAPIVAANSPASPEISKPSIPDPSAVNELADVEMKRLERSVERQAASSPPAGKPVAPTIPDPELPYQVANKKATGNQVDLSEFDDDQPGPFSEIPVECGDDAADSPEPEDRGLM